jgi:protein O-mannosyl-transferase
MGRRPSQKRSPDTPGRERPTKTSAATAVERSFAAKEILGIAPRPRDRYLTLAVCGLLVLAVFLVFGQTLGHEFVNYDDDDYVYRNPDVVKGLTGKGVVWAFARTHSYNWHPLTWLSHMLDCQVYGLEHPGGHHLTNVLLHAANAVLLLLVLRQMTARFWSCAFVAAVFAIHPLHVESVAWVAERKDVLSGLFFLLTLMAYIAYARRPFSHRRYLGVIALFALGLMAKPMLVTLPFVLLLLDYWPLGRFSPPHRENAESAKRNRLSTIKRLLVEKLPLVALSAGSCMMTWIAQRQAITAVEGLALPWRLANALVAYVAYLGQFFYPVHLAVPYPYPASPPPPWEFLGAASLLMGLSVAAFVWWRRHPYLLVGWLWYLGMLVPVIGLVQVGSQARADRYTYLPQIGFCIALTWLAVRVTETWPYRRLVHAAASVVVLAVLTVTAWHQTSCWKDGETLWTHALDHTSHNAVAHAALGSVLYCQDNTDEAITEFREALKIKSDFAQAHYNLGVALADQQQFEEAISHYRQAFPPMDNVAEAHYKFGASLVECDKVDEAIAQYRRAVEIMPDFADAHYKLAVALSKGGQLDEAIKSYGKVLELVPNLADAHYNLGALLAARRQYGEAVDHYRKALEIRPDYFEAYYNRGLAYAAQGRLDAAITDYQKALEINPESSVAQNNLGNALLLEGKTAAAMPHFQEALKIKPDYAEAHYNYGLALGQQDRLAEAIVEYRKALELKPGFPEAHNNLGKALFRQGRVDEAIACYQKALQLNPRYAYAHNHLGLALLQQGIVDEAITHFQKAVEISPDFAEARRNLDAARAKRK